MKNTLTTFNYDQKVLQELYIVKMGESMRGWKQICKITTTKEEVIQMEKGI